MPKQQTRRIGESLLIVLIIIVLVGVWIKGIDQYSAQAHEAQAQQQMYTLAKALRVYYINNDSYPAVVNNMPFCEPFRMYKGQLCLYQLIDDYISIENIRFSGVRYIYAPTRDNVILAADILATEDTSMGNRCTVGNVTFWCLILPR
ncbi:MAG: hypothetical protein ACKKL4_02080 [Patescibacteria group bacterium]